MCQKKVWRTKKVLEDGDKKLKFEILTWAAVPLDHLWMRLQWLDTRGGALLDCTGPRSPFVECRAPFRNMMTTPFNEGPMRTLECRP